MRNRFSFDNLSTRIASVTAALARIFNAQPMPSYVRAEVNVTLKRNVLVVFRNLFKCVRVRYFALNFTTGSRR